MDQKSVEDLFRNYSWRKQELTRLKNIYGTQSSADISLEVMGLRSHKIISRWKSYEDAILKAEELINIIVDDKQEIIADCMMDGLSYREIAKHLGVSRQKLLEMKKQMLNHLSECAGN